MAISYLVVSICEEVRTRERGERGRESERERYGKKRGVGIEPGSRKEEGKEMENKNTTSKALYFGVARS